METHDQTVPSTVIRLRTPLAREEIVGMVWAAAGALCVPVRCWPMQIALETLESQTPPAGRVSRALEAWPAGRASHGQRRAGMDGLLRDLAIEGCLSVEGRGWDAAYRPTRRWLDHGELALVSLNGAERAAVATAAQRLVASLTIWSKKSFTDPSDRSPMS